MENKGETDIGRFLRDFDIGSLGQDRGGRSLGHMGFHMSDKTMQILLAAEFIDPRATNGTRQISNLNAAEAPIMHR